MSNKNLAIIGIGRWGRNIARVFYNLNVLKYICDKNFETIYDVEPQKINDILTNKKINIIIISTPINSHFNLSLISIKKKKIFL